MRTQTALLDRLVYDNPEVLLAPLRDTALLAKQAATLDQMSGGRLVLGLGVGGRDDDHQVTGIDMRIRGRRLDEQMAVMRRLWSGEPYGDDIGPIGPAPARPGGPEVLFGGFEPAAIERVGRWGDGFLAAAPPAWAGGLFGTARTCWKEYGRDGEPRNVAQVNVALGPDEVVQDARTNMHAYYAFTGMPGRMVAGLITTPAEIRDAIARFADLGADEVTLYCYGLDPHQVDRLADLV
ncbi:LLM class flavin-dependent oxidoreductase [Streptomyces sp. NPDC050147]|uniref:LLM class flavin-dependent oxidoreductase n=1 Tax=Streptomyces sp. NPDC050147 TaxID=3155513 RepID=UPI003445098B